MQVGLGAGPVRDCDRCFALHRREIDDAPIAKHAEKASDVLIGEAVQLTAPRLVGHCTLLKSRSERDRFTRYVWQGHSLTSDSTQGSNRITGTVCQYMRRAGVVNSPHGAGMGPRCRGRHRNRIETIAPAGGAVQETRWQLLPDCNAYDAAP